MAQQKQPFDSSLQDLIYSVDASAGSRLLRATLFSSFVIVLMVLITAREFRGFDTPSAMDSAQLARNLAQTGRYETACVRPFTMAHVASRNRHADPKIRSHPELFRAPLYPALLAGAFRFYDLIGIELFPTSRAMEGMRVYPAEQWVIIPLHHFFTALSGILLYLLGCRLFSRKTGVLAVTTYFLTDRVWAETLRGDGMPVLLFFGLGAFYFATVSMMAQQDGRPLYHWGSFLVLSALFSAAAGLTHYAGLVIVPGIALYLLLSGAFRRHALWTAVVYGLLIALAISPWIMRNIRQSGMPFGLAPYVALEDTERFADDSLMRTMSPAIRPMAAFRVARAKWVGNASSMAEAFIAAPGVGILTMFFFVSFFYRFVRPQIHRLRWGVAFSLLLFFAGACFFDPDALRLIHLFRPFVILYGLAFFLILLDRLDFRVPAYKSAVTALVVGTAALPLLVTVFFAKAPGLPYPPYHVPFVMRVGELLRPNEVLCSDMPWATAWYGKRTSILLPQTVPDYLTITDYEQFISGLYITTLTKDQPFTSRLLDGPDRSWLPVMMGRTEGFPLRHGFSLHRQDQLFLTDSVRWQTDAGRSADRQGRGQ